MINVQSIYKSFKSKKKKKLEVLKNITFQAHPGEIYGLLGPNGAGKTTTLRLIATLLKADSGSITVDSLDVQKDSRKVRDKIGFLTSDMKLSGNLSPKELLVFFGQLNHLPKEKIVQRIDELSKDFGLVDFLDRPIEKLSTGMKQKASLAVSLIHDPDIIIFDEPTNGLDIIASKIVVDFINDYKKRGKTIVLSTHIMAEADKICDRVGIIMDGELVENGKKVDLLSKHGLKSIEDVFYKLANERGMFKNV